jgi:hypothetical protein
MHIARTLNFSRTLCSKYQNPRTQALDQQFAMTQQFAMAWKVQGLERESLSLSTPQYIGSLGGQELLGLLPRRVLSTKGDSIAYKHVLHPKH